MEKVYSERISNINKFFLFISIILFSLTLGVYLSKQESTGFFIFGNLGKVKFSLYDSNGYRIEPSKYTPAYDMWLYLIHIICGLSFVEVAFTPIGILITPFVYFVLTKKIFNSYLLAFIGSFYIISEIAQTGWYNTFAYAWVRPVYLVFILLFINILNKEIKPEHVLVLFLMFWGATFTHYTVPVWVITFIVVLYCISKLEGGIYSKRLSLIIVLLVVSYISINKVFYDVFIPSLTKMVNESGYFDAISVFFMKLKSYASGHNIISEKYVYYPSRGIYSTVRLMLNFLFLIPILLSLPPIIKKFINILNRKDNTSNFNVSIYIYCAFLITIIVQAFVYGNVTGISNQFILFMGPIIMLIALNLFGSKKIRSIFLVALLVLSTTTLSLSLSYEDEYLRYSSIEPSGIWLLTAGDHQKHTHVEDKPVVLSTISYYYYVNFIGIDYNKSIRLSYFTSDTYEKLVSHKYSGLNKLWDYVIIDKFSYDYHVSGERIKYFEPLSRYSVEIYTNSNLNKVYDDSIVLIFKT